MLGHDWELSGRLQPQRLPQPDIWIGWGNPEIEVVVATPPVDVPLTTNVTSIKVHIAYSPFQASTRY